MVRFGQESADNARVWSLYRDRRTVESAERFGRLEKTLDNLPVFVRAFIILLSLSLLYLGWSVRFGDNKFHR